MGVQKERRGRDCLSEEGQRGFFMTFQSNPTCLGIIYKCRKVNDFVDLSQAKVGIVIHGIKTSVGALTKI